ncbi:hypothetical protein GIB67_017085 [Kingdonia uniflora]|uniref:NADP-dependent oxidoreductase domain-containing protein n=1 Tax=Kingdonia uniflora TaxID=39325 RepID=A0A7J7ND29_9MAGN|nr:hypothetical protein GIB67_017085 [Kingdonia uniflora]
MGEKERSRLQNSKKRDPVLEVTTTGGVLKAKEIQKPVPKSNKTKEIQQQQTIIPHRKDNHRTKYPGLGPTFQELNKRFDMELQNVVTDRGVGTATVRGSVNANEGVVQENEERVHNAQNLRVVEYIAPHNQISPSQHGPKVAKFAILNAIKLGYRHFDTALIYETEQPVGAAIAEAFQLGIIKSREELFITSKLWCSDAHQGRVLPALQMTLKLNLQLDYLDLYLIHWPLSSKPGKYEYPIPKDELLPMDFKSVEMNPLWQQRKLLELCKAKGINVTAYSTLGFKMSRWGSNRVSESEVLKNIAEAKGKTHAQVCFRWVYEQRVCVLMKSFNEERMKENQEIFTWYLSDDDSKRISEQLQSKGNLGDPFISDQGPFKSEEELWDGGI